MVRRINESLHQEGQALRTKILGSDRVREALAKADDLIEYYHIIGHECAYGLIWGRPGLALRDRSLITVAMLAASGGSHDVLKAHIKGAVTNGCSRADIAGLLATAVVYIGAGVARTAIEVARSAFLEMGLVEAAPGEEKATAQKRSAVAAWLHSADLVRSAASGLDTPEPLSSMVGDYYIDALWADGELNPHSRLLVVLAMLTSTGRLRDLAIHLRAALANGCTRDEIAEVFLTSLIYVGLPACLDGFRTASAVYAEEEAAKMANSYNTSA